MVLGVVLGRLVGVMGGVDAVAVRHVSMMAGLFVVAGLVVPRGFSMVMGGVFVVVRRGRVMIVTLMRLCAHRFLHGIASADDFARIP